MGVFFSTLGLGASLWVAYLSARGLGLTWLLNRGRSALQLAGHRRREELEYRSVQGWIEGMISIIEVGLLPEDEQFQKIDAIGGTLARFVGPTIQDLRRQGGALLPTLRSCFKIARSHLERSKRAHAQTAQARMQASVLLLLVPASAGLFHVLLPDLSTESRRLWWGGVCVSASLAGWAAWATLKLSIQVGHYHLARPLWPLPMLTRIFGERVCTWIKMGRTQDAAWNDAQLWLLGQGECGSWILRYVQRSLWSPALEPLEMGGGPAILVHARSHLERLRIVLQNSLLSGSPCLERIQNEVQSFELELTAVQEEALSRVPTLSLRPLFIGGVPAVLGVLGMSLFLMAVEVFSESL